MDKEGLVVLKATVSRQIEEIEKLYVRIEDRKQKRGKSGIESLAYQLHNLYCAFEDLFKIVTDSFDNHIQNKTHYHIELLRRMTMTIEGIRPALISQENYELLDNLRAFRHLFRHAYSYELDERKIKIVLADAIKLKKRYQNDINIFLKSIEGRRSSPLGHKGRR
ncbi:MAG: hypothetical protein AB1422_02455 [bacterium]